MVKKRAEKCSTRTSESDAQWSTVLVVGKCASPAVEVQADSCRTVLFERIGERTTTAVMPNVAFVRQAYEGIVKGLLTVSASHPSCARLLRASS